MNTPRTDAIYPPNIIDREFAEQGRNFGWGTLYDMRECSRKLEKELNLALWKLAAMRGDEAEARRIEREGLLEP